MVAHEDSDFDWILRIPVMAWSFVTALLQVFIELFWRLWAFLHDLIFWVIPRFVLTNMSRLIMWSVMISFFLYFTGLIQLLDIP